MDTLNDRVAKYHSTQEKFWAGDFGDEYVERNIGENLIASNTALFSRVLENTRNVRTVLELGANIGLNLMAIRSLLPSAAITGIEINSKACEIMAGLDYVEAIEGSLFSPPTGRTWDIVFTKGVLIHQSPDMLQRAYEVLYDMSNHYIFICEYYSPVPVDVMYRGYDSVLFKRDFAGELLDKYPDLRLVDYGFVYHKDNNFPGDDLNWFLMEK